MTDARTIIATAIKRKDPNGWHWTHYIEWADAVLVALTTAGLLREEQQVEALLAQLDSVKVENERLRHGAVVSRESSRSALIELRAWVYEHTLIEAGTNNRIVDQALLLQQLRAALAVPTPGLRIPPMERRDIHGHPAFSLDDPEPTTPPRGKQPDTDSEHCHRGIGCACTWPECECPGIPTTPQVEDDQVRGVAGEDE